MKFKKNNFLVLLILTMSCQSIPRKENAGEGLALINATEYTALLIRNKTKGATGLCNQRIGGSFICLGTVGHEYEIYGAYTQRQNPSGVVIIDYFFDAKTVATMTFALTEKPSAVGTFEFEESGDWDKADAVQRKNFKVIYPAEEIPTSAVGQAFSLNNMLSKSTKLKKLASIKASNITPQEREQLIQQQREALAKAGWL